MLRIAFAGTPEFALPALDALAASTHRLVGALTQPDRPAGRGRELRASAVKQRALELGLPVSQPARLASEADRAEFAAWQAELLVVVAYGLLLPPAVLASPRLGCLNIHASLLPRWRGAAPIQRAILAGDAESGVSIMRMDAGLDTGPVYAQRRVPIGARMTSADLHEVLARAGAELLLEVIASLERGTAVAREQATDGVTYAHKLEKREALIDWSASATHIARQVRACNPWPIAETLIAGQQLRIWQADALATMNEALRGQADALATPASAPPGTVLGLRGDRLLVACGEGVLAIERLQGAGRRAIGAAEFARGIARGLDGLKLG
ncbi:MAG TPA: methionyl-tRNA formyltransferase [Steroidobacteraceae bacterium]|nr:methionyl-tRNA formyltransferase [Steroidobacteraceae bacterium]